ncbi:MAG: 4Fe-4S binding protein [Thermoplasmatota archaeon]
MNRLGVFVCHCGVNISDMVDVEAVAEYASKLPGVVVSRTYKYMCSDTGAEVIKTAIKENDLNGIVIAACSPRMHEHTFRGVAREGGINPFMVEITNIREHCSWAHEDREAATDKAKVLVRGSVAKANLLEPLTASKTPVTPEAMVIGAGIAGIQAALDLADEGFKVFLVEREPTIGGRMAQLDKTFPTLDCSSCILTPKMMDAYHHPNVELLTYSEVESVEGSVGNYKVTVRKKKRYVDMEKCTGCNACALACRLKGRVADEFNMGMGKRSACYIPFPQAVPLKATIDPDSCLMLRFGKCGDGPLCVEACEPGAIDFQQKDEVIELNVGSIVVATGYDIMDVSKLYELGYARSPDIITTMELERLISSSGPTGGEVVLPSSGERPGSVTFILCVGSRDENECSWCCRIGCMSALKHVYLLREKLGKEVEINLCYTDIRSFGKGYEEFYRKIRGENTNFFRGRPSEVRVKSKGITIDTFDTTTNKLFEIATDMVVLVPALVPRSDAGDFARMMKLSRSADGFLLEAHLKLKPMDTFVNGIFIAGCAQGPKDISDTVSHASGAASRAAGILSQEELDNEPLVAVVDVDMCSGCKTCISLCPFKAIDSVTEEIEGVEVTHAEVNEGLCQGCGTCVAACPSGAIYQKGFRDDQILSMVRAFGACLPGGDN